MEDQLSINNKIMNRIIMNKCSIRLFILSLLAMVSSITYAYDFEVDGLCYNIIASDQVEVTYRTWNYGNYSGNIVIPETVNYNDGVYYVTSIGNKAFYKCSGLTGSLSIPNSVKSIGQEAFSECSGLTGSLIIPSSITSIGEKAFEKCSGFTGNLIIPNTVISIGESAFYECSGFNGTLTLPDTMESIPNAAFYFCGFVGTLSIPNTVTTIGDMAFDGCNFTGSLIIPNSVVSIGRHAFNRCKNITAVTLSNKMTTISEMAFAQCPNLSEVILPNSITSIGDWSFIDCDNLKTIDLPSSLVSIGSMAFFGSGLTTIVIPNNTTSIGGAAFQACKQLSSVTLGSGLTSIKELAFNGCSVLEDVYSNIINPFSIDNNIFSSISPKAILHIPKGTKDAYYQYDNWIRYFSKVLEEGEDESSQETDTYYSLYITATGNGSASIWGDVIRNMTQSYSIIAGASGTITFTPDDGYRVKSIKVNGNAVTTSTSYTITVNSETTVEVEFEAIPDTPTTYTISITLTGNGSALYSGDVIRGTTKSYSVNDGTNVTVNFNPDSGYRIKSLKVNGSSVSTTTSYSFTINSNTTIEVEFEPIPDTPSVTTYTLSITASGNGSANYGGEAIRESSRTYSVNEGSSVSISFTPDEGYRIESVKVNGSNIGKERSYSTTINANTTVEVVFEAIPVTTYTLTVTASGNGVATFDGTEVRNGSHGFTVNEGSDAIISFTPDKGYKVDAVKADGNEVEVSESYTISNITSDKTLEVVFAEMDRNFSIDGVGYQIESFDDNTVTLTGVQNSITLEVSDKISYQAQDWNIIGISENALENSDNLAAIIWNPEIPFTAKVANPNLLLYVKDEAYAPAGIRNVVVNGFAKAITLTDAQSGNNFYCPSAFITQSIIYTHNYNMKTGINESKGWETIALPFDVQQISHSGKGEIIPFARWNADNDMKPFWLYELKGTGFVEAEELKANTPYIISMPNNDLYPNDYQLSGRVTFSALNAEVKKSDDIQTATFGNNTFVPAFTNHNAESGYYVLNVNNDFETYQGSANVGSKFILNLRNIHPFEAYMTSTSGTRSIDIFDSMTTGIRDVLDITDSQKTQKVYDLSGRLIMTGTSLESIRQELPAGVYIINNKKMIIK